MPRIAEVEKLVAANPGQMSYDEYAYIYSLIREQSPGNLLVFGLGKDSPLWSRINAGYSLFIEDERPWIAEITPQMAGNFEIFPFTYSTRLDRWQEYVNDDKILEHNKIKITDDARNQRLLQTKWDTILIDGPAGDVASTPGRMMPISTAYSLTKKNLLIHDCNRIVENVFSRVFFGNDFFQIEKLRHYRF